MKKEQGITLISLVVTIIVLIILAGISINLILGQDGIINKAKEAKQNMEYAQIEEQAQLNELYNQMSQESGGSISYDVIAKLSEFKTKVSKAITEMGVETSEDATADTMANNIKSISGLSNLDILKNIETSVHTAITTNASYNISGGTASYTWTGSYPHISTFTATSDSLVFAHVINVGTVHSIAISYSDNCELYKIIEDSDVHKIYMLKVPNGETVTIKNTCGGTSSFRVGFASVAL